jgi:hypothetical protein
LVSGALTGSAAVVVQYNVENESVSTILQQLPQGEMIGLASLRNSTPVSPRCGATEACAISAGQLLAMGFIH